LSPHHTCHPRKHTPITFSLITPQPPKPKILHCQTHRGVPFSKSSALLLSAVFFGPPSVFSPIRIFAIYHSYFSLFTHSHQFTIKALSQMHSSICLLPPFLRAKPFSVGVPLHSSLQISSPCYWQILHHFSCLWRIVFS